MVTVNKTVHRLEYSIKLQLVSYQYRFSLWFKQVIFNHGNKELGKDYILVTKNIFDELEYYGVQAKAGDMRGTATFSITEISNQIESAFNIPIR